MRSARFCERALRGRRSNVGFFRRLPIPRSFFSLRVADSRTPNLVSSLAKMGTTDSTLMCAKLDAIYTIILKLFAILKYLIRINIVSFSEISHGSEEARLFPPSSSSRPRLEIFLPPQTDARLKWHRRLLQIYRRRCAAPNLLNRSSQLKHRLLLPRHSSKATSNRSARTTAQSS